MRNTKKRGKKRSDIVKILKGEKPLKVIVNLSCEQRAKLDDLQKEFHLSMAEIINEALTSYLDMKQFKNLWENGDKNDDTK
jgi:hypothetical protein